MVTSFTSNSVCPVLQSRVGEDQAGTHPGPTISDNWLISCLVQESSGNIHSAHYKPTHSPAPRSKLKNLHTKYAKTLRCQKKRLREINAYLIPGEEFRMYLPSRVFLTLKETFPSTLLCGEMKFQRWGLTPFRLALLLQSLCLP